MDDYYFEDEVDEYDMLEPTPRENIFDEYPSCDEDKTWSEEILEIVMIRGSHEHINI